MGKVKNVFIFGMEVFLGIYIGLNVVVNWDKVDIKRFVYIGSMIRIEDGVKIVGFSMIGLNCWICSGVIVDSSVIFEYFCLGLGVCLVDKLVFGCYCVDKIGVFIDV